MNQAVLKLFSAVVLGLSCGLTFAQDVPAASPETQTPPPFQPRNQGVGPRGGRGFMGDFAGRGITGTVTAVAAGHYMVKTDSGDTYTVYYSANTRIMKQMLQRRGEGGEGGGNQPQALKPTDIKVDDAVAAMGDVDATAKSVGAMLVMQMDPERARQMREMQANYGKTWLMGKVTAIDGVKVTLASTVDNLAHTFQADENTALRKRRDPITLADIQVGDVVRVEGTVKDGAFIAASVNVMGMPPGGTPSVPRNAPPASAPQAK